MPRQGSQPQPKRRAGAAPAVRHHGVNPGGNMNHVWKVLVGATIGVIAIIGLTNAAGACGGFFCQNNPVDQTGERILFSVNDDGTITSLIEIQYLGSAEDFSWILPLPSAISADDIAVPEDGELVFDELHSLTDVRIIAPPRPACADDQALLAGGSPVSAEADVQVLASGEVGPFGFDVITSVDPAALTSWLRDNNYRVTEAMEPLINVYVEEQFAFLAMRLLDGENSDSIQPVEITYEGTQPMIPIRLTAVAAASNMPVFTWIFADEQAVPDNYVHMDIATAQITFSTFGGNDYQSLLRRKADEHGGRAFITEFAQPSRLVDFSHPYLVAKAEAHRYITRLTTDISPDEMTVDPVFAVVGGRDDVSNVRDASRLTGVYACERDGDVSILDLSKSDALDTSVLFTAAADSRELTRAEFAPSGEFGSAPLAASGSNQLPGTGSNWLPVLAALIALAALGIDQARGNKR
jgi:hypothetical protein